jgi:hypothetical protein
MATLKPITLRAGHFALQLILPLSRGSDCGQTVQRNGITIIAGLKARQWPDPAFAKKFAGGRLRTSSQLPTFHNIRTAK